MARLTARFRDSTVWFAFAVLFAVFVLLELAQFVWDYKNFDPFWLGWDIAFGICTFIHALGLRLDGQ